MVTSRPGYSSNICRKARAAWAAAVIGGAILTGACTPTAPSPTPAPPGKQEANAPGAGPAERIAALKKHAALGPEAAMQNVMQRLRKEDAVCVQFKSTASRGEAERVRRALEAKHQVVVEVTPVDITTRKKRRRVTKTWFRLCAGAFPSARAARKKAAEWSAPGGALAPYLDKVKRGQAAYLLKATQTTAQGRPNVAQAQLASRIAPQGATTLLRLEAGVLLVLQAGADLVFIPPDVENTRTLPDLEGYAACAVCARALTEHTATTIVHNADFMEDGGADGTRDGADGTRDGADDATAGAELLVSESGHDAAGADAAVWTVVQTAPTPRVRLRVPGRLRVAGYETRRALLVVPGERRAVFITKRERGPMGDAAACTEKVTLETLADEGTLQPLSLADLSDVAIRDAAIAADGRTVYAVLQSAMAHIEAGGGREPVLAPLRVLGSRSADAPRLRAVHLSTLALAALFESNEGARADARRRFVDAVQAVAGHPVVARTRCTLPVRVGANDEPGDAASAPLVADALFAAVFALRGDLASSGPEMKVAAQIDTWRALLARADPAAQKKRDAAAADLKRRASLR